VILKDYQRRALSTVRTYLENLAEWREKAKEFPPDAQFDWAKRAWEKTVPRQTWNESRNGLGKPLPSFCLKIPTGGGKTLLATRVMDLAGVHYRKKQAGLVLWIVPTTQIYDQTLRALRDRDHPYRQQLDLASAGRTMILEKTSRFAPRDVEERLCVMLLMLPSANRETREQLRMFRDSGGHDRFFPPDDDDRGHADLLRRVPNLDTFPAGVGMATKHAKTSLGNVLRLHEPLIVLDEGHKAYSRNARETLAGFNPCLIVELSATPPAGANVLVDIRGKELLAEEMIKLDLHIHNGQSVDWKDTLLRAVELRDELESEARHHEAETGIYIRPICLVQVERTGRDQRLAGFIHAEDVREYLLAHPGIHPEHVAVKTSQRDELRELEDATGLLSRDCPIRFIITKQALQEGWDCSFAYVLAVLTNPGSKTALTQLVGRILRQPHARKTTNRCLNESYVFAFRRRGDELLKEIRKGFGQEGLGDVQGRLLEEQEDAPTETPTRTMRPRRHYRKQAKNLVLPAFMIRDGKHWRLVHYEADILARVSWSQVDISPLAELTLGEPPKSDANYRVGPDGEMVVMVDDAPSSGKIDYVFAARHLLDVAPNPWRGSEFARRVFESLIEKHGEPQVVGNYIHILEELGKRLASERDRLAEAVFRDLLATGEMRFLVVTEKLAGTRLPRELTRPKEQDVRTDGTPYQQSLFKRVGEGKLNGLEQQVATYLDQQERLYFWHRNRARKDYFVQGWKRNRFFADFIVTSRSGSQNARDPYDQVFVLETKGLHLRGAADTEYKRSVFDLCSEKARQTNWAEFVPAMQNRDLRYEVVDEAEWEQRLTNLFAG